MDLKNIVTSREISKRLEELGVIQESHFEWRLCKNGRWFLCDNQTWIQNPNIEKLPKLSAFTVSELGELLPAGYFGNKSEEGTYLPAKADILTKTFKTVSNSMITNDWTMANVYGCMLIYLLENGLCQV